MTEKEKAIRALKNLDYEGTPPHMEMDIQLWEQAIGRPYRDHKYFHANRDKQDDDSEIQSYVEDVIALARRFNTCMIQCIRIVPDKPFYRHKDVYSLLKEKGAKDDYLLTGFVDGTERIPDGNRVEEISYRIADDRDGYLDELKRRCDWAIEEGLKLIEYGADVIFMTSDYCFNSGPFFSPYMFHEFVAPFLEKQVSVFKKAGAFTVKHTDGNIMPIIDQLVDTGIDCLHSLDPMAGVDIAEVKAKYGDRICLMGNVSCAVLQTGPLEEIKKGVLYALKHGGRKGYIFSSSNTIFKGIPLENYEYMLSLNK
ncbi:MAG: hypothetical protein GX754_01995 [Clostridiaceae bacterium]|nr:hypothetical protein [Clostridiaceae bacterium]